MTEPIGCAGVPDIVGPMRSLAAGLIMLLLVAACASNRPSAKAAGFSGSLGPAISGMNGSGLSQLPSAEVGLQLSAMASHGVKVVRSDAAWATVEPSAPLNGRPRYQWGTYDNWVKALAQQHLTWQPIIDYAVGWAKPAGCLGFCPPAANSTFATFAQAVAARYGAGGSFWTSNPSLPYLPAQTFEIWNEENVSTFRVSPARFGRLYLAARRAIRAVDSEATVLVGGLADDSRAFDSGQDYPAQYVVQLFHADKQLRGNVDGIALHPYGASAADVIDWVSHFRAWLDAIGERSLPIYITEFGWTTADRGEAWRAAQMAQVASALVNSNCGIALIEPYDWLNQSYGGSGGGDFGLVSNLGVSPLLRQAGQQWFQALAAATSGSQTTACG